VTLSPLYTIVDREVAQGFGWSVPGLAKAYLAGGSSVLQIRVQEATSSELLSWCGTVVVAAREYDASVIVNNRLDIAQLVGANGVHLGQHDLTVNTARQLLGSQAMVGLSTHNLQEIESSATEMISYVAVGPVFNTDTKDTKCAAVGLDLVSAAAAQKPWRPVVAIGGITLERAPAVLEAGASAVAVISDLLFGGDPERRVREYLDVLA